MSRKGLHIKQVNSLTDLPERVFDLLPMCVERYGWKDCLFAGRVNGEWVKYDSKTCLEMAEAVSLGLMQCGVCQGDRVALVANNSPQWNIIDFAVQQLGAIVVPIYSTMSRDDYAHIIRHSEPKALFIENSTLLKKIKDIVDDQDSISTVITIQPTEGMTSFDQLLKCGRSQRASKKRLEEIKATVQSDDVATIIYTSGTTGSPKGVMLTHHNLLADISYYLPHYPADYTHTALSFLPLSHVYERSVRYCHVYLGVSTYYAENVGTIMRDIAEVRPNHFSTVPRVIEKAYSSIMLKGTKLKGFKKKVFYWAFDLAGRYDETGRDNSLFFHLKKAFADRLVYKEIREAFGGRIKFIISGGASIQPHLVRVFSAIGMPVVEGYGLTETSPVVCTNSLVAGVLKAGTIGLPCGDLDVKTVPETGEIIVKGASVMKGYYKDEEQTRIAIDENGYYHTGDKGEFDEDGLVHITGRIKEIFKDSMGKYISPAQIEDRFGLSSWISNMMVVGENQKFAAALIVPNFEHMRLWCKENDIACDSKEELLANKALLKRFREEVEEYNKYFGEYEQIKRYRLLDHEWTIEGGELTPSLKIRRAVLMTRYKDTIEELFAS